MRKQREDCPGNMWIQFCHLFLFVLVNAACAANREPFTCHLDVDSSSGERIETVEKTSEKPIRLFEGENNVKLTCRHSSPGQTGSECHFSWRNKNLTTPILNNFSVSNTAIVSCHVSCGSSRCNISVRLDVMKPNILTMSKLSRKANLKSIRNIASSTDETNLMTSPNLTETTGISDTHLIVLLCLFGLIIVILSCLAGNASYLAAKFRSTSPNLQGTIETQDEILSRDRNSLWQIQTTPAQQNYVNSFTTTRSCMVPNNVLINLEQMRSRSCYDKSIFPATNSRQQQVPMPSVPPFRLQRRMSSSDGCIYDRTANFFMSSCVGNMQTDNHDHKGLPCTTEKMFDGNTMYNTTNVNATSPNSDNICNDVATCRTRLESEFTFGRDRFLSNALKKPPPNNTGKKRLSSQFSYERDRFLSNAVRNVALDGRRRGVGSLNRRTQTRPGTMTSIFSLTHRYTRSYSRLSSSTLEDVFMNEHIYETISLDDLRSMSSGDLLFECKHKCLDNVDEIIEESFPVYAKSEKTSSKQTDGSDKVDNSQEKGKERPSLYITLDQVSQNQRRCSLPSPTEAVDMGFSGDPNYVSHRLGSLLASSSFRSEGHISCSSSKLNPFDIC